MIVLGSESRVDSPLGNHGDIGGGWGKDSEHYMLSHTCLVWMLLEAEKAGLKLDPGCFGSFIVVPGEYADHDAEKWLV